MDHLEERGKILGRVRGQDTWATVVRFCRSQAGLGEHPTKLGGVEEQDGSVDAEECAPAQRFHVPVLEVEGLVWSYGRKVDENLLIGSIWDREVDGGSSSEVSAIVRSERVAMLMDGD